MSGRQFTREPSIGKLRAAELALAQEQMAAQLCRNLGIAEQKFYPSHHEYGGLNIWKGGS
jgi:hypothetical protein